MKKKIMAMLTSAMCLATAALNSVNVVSAADEKTNVSFLMGDVNEDGSFGISDVVLLQKWLLGVPDTHLANWKAADFCEDNRLDVVDLTLMKRALIEKLNGSPELDDPEVREILFGYPDSGSSASAPMSSIRTALKCKAFCPSNEALCVDGVIELPVRRCGHSTTGTEYWSTRGGGLGHRHQRIKASETPTPDTDALRIHIRQLTQSLSGGSLIVGFELTQMLISTLLPLRTTETCAATIDNGADEALLGEGALESTARIETVAPGIGNLLRAWAGILVHNDGVLPGRIKITRLEDPGVEGDTVGGSQSGEFPVAKGGIGLLLEFLIGDQGLKRTTGVVTESGNGGLGAMTINIHEIAEVAGEGSTVSTSLLGEFRGLSLTVGAIDGTTQGRLLGGGVIEATRGGIITMESGNLEITLGDGLLQCAI